MKKVLIALFALGSLSVASISATQAAPSFGGTTHHIHSCVSSWSCGQ